MYPQDAEMIVEDALAWYGDKTSRGYIQRSNVEPRGAVWIVPLFGTPLRAAVSVKEVATQVQTALDEWGNDLEPVLRGRAIGFVSRCTELIALCED